MQPHLTPDGWLRVPYAGPDIAIIEMEADGTGWQPAYLDWEDGQRVAQVRWRQPERPTIVNIRVNGGPIAFYRP